MDLAKKLDYIICPHCGMEIPTEGKQERRPKRTKHKLDILRTVIEKYLEVKGWSNTSMAKDQGKWGRWMIEADKLLALCDGDAQKAARVIVVLADRWGTRLDWTLAAVVRQAPDTMAEVEARMKEAKPMVVNSKPWECEWCSKGLDEVTPHESGVICQKCYEQDQREIEISGKSEPVVEFTSGISDENW